MSFNYHDQLSYYTSLSLNVTDDCNLHCKYCFVKQQPKYMKLETAIKAIDNLYENCKLIETKYPNVMELSQYKYRIFFFGGEPLLCYDSIIKPVIEYCEEKYPKLFMYGMTTNGTLLNEERINFFAKYPVSIQISMDGDQKSQDINRPLKFNQSSFALLNKNIDLFKEHKVPYVFRGTISQDSVQYLFENYLFFEKNHLIPMAFSPELKHPWNEEQIKILKQELEKIFLYRIFQFSQDCLPVPFTNVNKAYNLLIYKNLIHEQPDMNWYTNEQKILNVCGTGFNGTLTIEPDGEAYSCQERPSYKFAEDDIFHIGTDCKIDPKKQKKLMNKIYEDFCINNGYSIVPNSLFTCKQCYLKDICNLCFGCISCGFDKGQANLRPVITCIFENEMIKNAIAELQVLKEMNKENILDKYNQYESAYYKMILKYGEEKNNV